MNISFEEMIDRDEKYAMSVIVDKTFLSKLSEKRRTEFIDYYYRVYSELSRSKNIVDKNDFRISISRIGMFFVYRYCPYCKKTSLTLLRSRTKESHTSGTYCSFCGQMAIIEKLDQTINKVQTIRDLYIELENEELNTFDLRKHRNSSMKSVLLEQMTVLLATGVEVFLKDIYASILNLTLIKSGRTEFERFLKEKKNSFMNVNKIISGYKELGIDLKNEIDVDKRKALNVMFNRRHVIIHNSCFADKEYINSNNENLRLGDKITITVDDVDSYVDAVIHLENIIRPIYSKIYEEERVKEFEEVIWKIAPFTLVYGTGVKRMYRLLHAPNFTELPDINKIYRKPISPSDEELKALGLK